MMFKIPAKKSLGQNFLINPRIVEKIVEASDISAGDIVLEVGPGTGNLTRALAGAGARVIAIEKDRRVIEELRNEFAGKNVEVIEGDVLEFEPNVHGLAADGYKIVANLPYYITSHFIRTVFEKWPQPKLMVLMVQKEVAQRIITKPPHMNLLALSVQYYAEPEIITHVARGNFRPEPNVDSSVIKLIPRQIISVPTGQEKLFELIRTGFSSKRKTLLNNLSTIAGKNDIITALNNLGLAEKVRAENLSLAEWIKLENILKLSPS